MHGQGGRTYYCRRGGMHAAPIVIVHADGTMKSKVLSHCINFSNYKLHRENQTFPSCAKVSIFYLELMYAVLT